MYYDAGTDIEIKRRRKLAEALQKAGQQPQGTQIVTGGQYQYAVPNSPLAGLANAITSGVGQYQEAQADKMETEQASNKQKMLADAIGKISGGDYNAAAEIMASNPEMADSAVKLIEMGAKRNEPISLKEGETLIDPKTMQPIFKSASSEKPPSGFRWKDEAKTQLEPIAGGPGEQMPAELAARTGLAKKALADMPNIKPMIESGAATGPIDYLYGSLGYGQSGEVMRRNADGVDALRRMLTGAGMPESEASGYAKRFEATFTDTPEILASKMDNLENNLNQIVQEAMRGRGGFTPGPKTYGGQDQIDVSDPRVKKALDAGYSMEEIKQYMSGGR